MVRSILDHACAYAHLFFQALGEQQKKVLVDLSYHEMEHTNASEQNPKYASYMDVCTYVVECIHACVVVCMYVELQLGQTLREPQEMVLVDSSYPEAEDTSASAKVR